VPRARHGPDRALSGPADGIRSIAVGAAKSDFGDKFMSGPSPARSPWLSARTTAKLAVILLFICQFLPFSAGTAFISHENEDPLTTRGGDDSLGTYHPGYVAEISSIPGDVGWQANPYAWIILIVLAAYFFTKLHDRPGWTRWGYWVAVVLAMGCTGGPIPPVSKMGGLVAAAGLALMIYAAYLHEQTKSPYAP
jgi:hypothetical protein